MSELIELEKGETTTTFWNRVRAMDHVIQKEKEARKKKKAKKKTNNSRFYRNY